MAIATSSTGPSFGSVETQTTHECGYSGRVTVTSAAARGEDDPVLIFVDSELLGSLVLTRAQADELGEALKQASTEDRVTIANPATLGTRSDRSDAIVLDWD